MRKYLQVLFSKRKGHLQLLVTISEVKRFKISSSKKRKLYEENRVYAFFNEYRRQSNTK